MTTRINSATNGEGEGQASPRLEILLPNGVWIKKRFCFFRTSLESCIIHGQRDQYSVEITHRCQPRHLLHEELIRMVPNMIHGENMCWFRTLNNEENPGATCLFDGGKLEVNLTATFVPEFGICFSRSSFIIERERLNIDDISTVDYSGDWAGWTRREPTDADRIRVNRRATYVPKYAILSRFLILAESPLWPAPSSGGPDFKEDGVGLYTNYFKSDIVVDSRHMKTVRGSALIDVVENHVQASS